jgi:hypothetical protein
MICQQATELMSLNRILIRDIWYIRVYSIEIVLHPSSESETRCDILSY